MRKFEEAVLEIIKFDANITSTTSGEREDETELDIVKK